MYLVPSNEGLDGEKQSFKQEIEIFNKKLQFYCFK